ncbi:poly(U)-specific 3'-to-5' RNA exonuclease [Basidiobolus ranarum]|uniref:U6 snRNA phosphodiesterase n=1 Tax=Basidiobolus ranarum TaxID=34480 RepID=A0ABR2W4L2_9FUNG
MFSGLVDYGSSSESESEANTQSLNTIDKKVTVNDSKLKRKDREEAEVELGKKKLPPLPSEFLDLFKEKTRESDNPSLHEGRLRTTPHVVGNWATYVYIDVSLNSEFIELIERINEKAKSLDSNIRSFAPKTEAYHVSLSRTVFLKVFHIDRFIRLLRERLSERKRMLLTFSKIVHFSNDEQTRSFISLEVGSGSKELREYVDCIDQVFEQFRLPMFYETPRFHTSVAWAVGGETINSHTCSKLQEFEEELGEFVFPVNEVKCKIGNQIHSLGIL